MVFFLSARIIDRFLCKKMCLTFPIQSRRRSTSMILWSLSAILASAILMFFSASSSRLMYSSSWACVSRNTHFGFISWTAFKMAHQMIKSLASTILAVIKIEFALENIIFVKCVKNTSIWDTLINHHTSILFLWHKCFGFCWQWNCMWCINE